MAKQLISMRLDPDLVEALDRISDRAGITRTEAIERCIRAGAKDAARLLDVASNPLMAQVVRLMAYMEDEDARKQVLRTLDRLADERRGRGQQALPGLEGA